MEEVIDDNADVAALQRARCSGLFAAVALALASVGIYSVLSCIVRGRSREIGIRTARSARDRRTWSAWSWSRG